MSREEALELVQHAADAEILWVSNEKMREQEYRHCVESYKPEEWIRILKTLYMRSKKRGSVTSMDKKYQQVTERALYSELAYALGIPVQPFRLHSNKSMHTGCLKCILAPVCLGLGLLLQANTSRDS